jgi:hypothetical protein
MKYSKMMLSESISKYLDKKNIKYAQKYFLLSEEDEYETLQLLDSLKIICFVILFSKEEEDTKIQILIETIIEEIGGQDYYIDDISDNEANFGQNQEENKDKSNPKFHK